MKSIIDKDLYNIDDKNNFIEKELKKRVITIIILNNLKYQEKMNIIIKFFQSIMKKLHKIIKIYIIIFK